MFSTDICLVNQALKVTGAKCLNDVKLAKLSIVDCWISLALVSSYSHNRPLIQIIFFSFHLDLQRHFCGLPVVIYLTETIF